MKPFSQITMQDIRTTRDGLDKQIKAKGAEATPNEKELLSRLDDIISKQTGVYKMPEGAADADDIDFNGNGPTAVWYATPAARKIYSKPISEIKEDGYELPTMETINKTHVHLCNVNTTDPKKVVSMLQGENWSPNGEAKDIIRKKGLNHVSITYGDIIVTPDRMVMVTRHGLYDLGAGNMREDVDYAAIVSGDAVHEAMQDAYRVGQTVYSGSKKGTFIRFSNDTREHAIIELDNGEYDAVPTAALSTKNPGMLQRAKSWVVGEDANSKKKV